MRIRIGRVVLDQVDRFVYMGMELSTLGGMKMEIDHRLNVGNSALGGVMEAWKKGNRSMGKKRRIYECVVVPKVMYGSEVWVLNADDRHRLEVFKMNMKMKMRG